METSASAAVDEALASKRLIPEKLWDRVVGRLMKDDHFSKEKAELILDGTLSFLKMSRAYPDHRFAPSKLIDQGWHTFLLYTRGYQEFCLRLGTSFIHHEPNDGEAIDLKKGGVLRVVQFMRENNIFFHEQLWITTRSSCKSNCSNNCTPDPNCSVDCKDDCR